eukprot:3828466-Amphidinium_carterae.1
MMQLILGKKIPNTQDQSISPEPRPDRKPCVRCVDLGLKDVYTQTLKGLDTKLCNGLAMAVQQAKQALRSELTCHCYALPGVSFENAETEACRLPNNHVARGVDCKRVPVTQFALVFVTTVTAALLRADATLAEVAMTKCEAMCAQALIAGGAESKVQERLRAYTSQCAASLGKPWQPSMQSELCGLVETALSAGGAAGSALPTGGAAGSALDMPKSPKKKEKKDKEKDKEKQKDKDGKKEKKDKKDKKEKGS